MDREGENTDAGRNVDGTIRYRVEESEKMDGNRRAERDRVDD